MRMSDAEQLELFVKEYEVNIQPRLCIEISVEKRSVMDTCINEAVEQMIDIALSHGSHGILISRLENGRFEVGLNASVPFGYTTQIDLRERHSAA